jgi:type II secretory pathway pseudopilin PulG
MRIARENSHHRGFTIVEFTIVMIVAVLLLSFGIPRLRYAAERTRVAAAVQYLADVRLAQDRYRAAIGRFARDVDDLELTASEPDHFEVGLLKRNSSEKEGWSLTLTRRIERSAYGAYTVCYNELGYDPGRSSLSQFPRISPIDDEAALRP